MGRVWYIERPDGDVSASWRIGEGVEVQSEEDAVIVRYSIFNLQARAEDVLGAECLDGHKIRWPWIKPIYAQYKVIEFRFSLDILRNEFDQLTDLDWLQGEVPIEPVVTYPEPQFPNRQAVMEFKICPPASMKRSRPGQRASRKIAADKAPGNSLPVKRVPVPTDTETAILTKSQRRCCICFGLNGDSEVKEGQIAHLDKDSSNNELDNLAWLCLTHHNQYDSKTSVTKNFTIREVKKYRDDLYSYLTKGRDR